MGRGPWQPALPGTICPGLAQHRLTQDGSRSHPGQELDLSFRGSLVPKEQLGLGVALTLPEWGNLAEVGAALLINTKPQHCGSGLFLQPPVPARRPGFAFL